MKTIQRQNNYTHQKSATSYSFSPFGWKVLSSYCQKDSLQLRFSTLSAWSMRVIFQSLMPWCLPSSKWVWNEACLTVFPLMKFIWADLLLLSLDWYLSVLPFYCLEHALHEKRYRPLLERKFKLSGFVQYSLWVLKDLNVSVVTTCFHFSHLVLPHDLHEPFFLSRGATFALTRLSFKLLALLNLTIGILSKTFPCSRSGVNSKCISDSTLLSFESTGWWVTLKTNLLLFPTLFHLFKTSDLENFLALRLCPLINLSL